MEVLKMGNFYQNKASVYAKLKTTIDKQPDPVQFKMLDIAVFEEYGFSSKLVRQILGKLIEAGHIKHNKKDDTYGRN